MKVLVFLLLITSIAEAKECTSIPLTSAATGRVVKVPYDLIKVVVIESGKTTIRSDKGSTAEVRESAEVIYKRIQECKFPTPDANISKDPSPMPAGR